MNKYEEILKNPLLKRILDNTTKLIIKEGKGYYKSNLLDLTDEEMDNDIDPEEKLKESWYQYIRYSTFYDEFKVLNQVTDTRDFIKSKVFQKPVIAKSGRIYHTVSSIPRLIRHSMRASKGQYLWEVDMSAAQPTLIMLEWLKMSKNKEEANLIINLILNGSIYKYIKENTIYFNGFDYSKLKKEVLQGFYEEYINSERNKALKSIFPHLMNWVNTIKRDKGYKVISHIGQKLEGRASSPPPASIISWRSRQNDG